MMLLPSNRIHNLLRAESAGAWIDPSETPDGERVLWLVSKLPAHVIRAIQVGAELSLLVALVNLDYHVPVLGLRVADDPQHPICVFGACRSSTETTHLAELLGLAEFPLQIHNEVFLPILSLRCKIDAGVSSQLSSVLETLPAEATSPDVRQSALDVVGSALQPGSARNAALVDLQQLPIEQVESEVLAPTVIGAGTFSVEDPDEGSELERLSLQAFDYLFPAGAYHQPQIRKKKGFRELCDLLALSRVREHPFEGVFVIQSKVASMTTEGLQRPTSRRAKSIQKNIGKAISQLKGAVRRLKDGVEVFQSDCVTRIEVDPEIPGLADVVEPLDLRERVAQGGHGIALVSDMHEGVDWAWVATELEQASSGTGFEFHVLDLRELQRLVSNSEGRPAVFDALLGRRAELTRQHGTALVRAHFLTE